MQNKDEHSLDFVTEAQQTVLRKIAAENRELEYRLRWISEQLMEFGSTPEELMFAHFNECMRMTVESRGVMASYFMAQQLQWHIVQVIGRLHAAGRAAQLTELPPDPALKPQV